MFAGKSEDEKPDQIAEGVQPGLTPTSSEDESVTDIETFIPPSEDEDKDTKSPVIDKIETIEKEALEKAEANNKKEDNEETKDSSVKVVTDDDLNELFFPWISRR